MQEMWVQSLGWGDPLEKEMATYSRRKWQPDRGAWQATFQELAKSWPQLSTIHKEALEHILGGQYMIPNLH